MPSPILVIKGASFVRDHWKSVLIAFVSVVFLIVFMPTMLLSSFLPSADDSTHVRYQTAATDAGLDWIELLTYATVLNDNNFSNTVPGHIAFDFINLSYSVYEKDESDQLVTRSKDGDTEYLINLTGGTAWLTSEEISKLPSVPYNYVSEPVVEWHVVESGTATSYDSILSALRKIGYTGSYNISVSDVLNYVNGLNDEHYSATIDKLTLLDVVSHFDDNHKQWAFDLYTALIDENNSYSGVREFYNTDPSYMAGIVLDADAYRLGDTKLLTGDTDIDSIFAGRLAALCEDYKKDSVGITSGYRSYAEQQRIWNNTSPERRGKYVAAPGHSRHQYKIAADVKGWLMYVTNIQLEKYGLWKPMSYENWHVEPIETKNSP